MNDPGLEEIILNDAKDVENQMDGEGDMKEIKGLAFLEPSRWWFASTAFPLIAGTFGPMGSAFSICALVVPWRVYIPPGGAAEQNGIEIPDPKWLISINAVQLVIALISNLYLLLNMARSVRFSIAQPITIIGWYISSLALIGLCACTSGPLIIEPRSEHAFTQAYYYAIFSAGLYFLVATLMLITAWGASKGHYEKEFQITMSQRTLMLQTISFLVYLLSGAAVYSHIEGWKFLDAVYWADFTLLTVGIGDYAPITHLGRGLLFPFAIGGIIILGLVIGSIRSLVLERGKVKMGARMVEKERRRLLKHIHKKKRIAVLEPVTEERTPIPPQASAKKFKDEPEHMTELERREQEFNLIRVIQESAAMKRRWTSLIISAVTWFILWFAGAAIFQAAEYGQGWSYFGSLYFSYTSLLTIGYGDFYPQSNSGKPFFVFWSLLAVPSLTILISNMGETIIKEIQDLTLWVGNITVLPGESGVKNTLKESGNKFTRGRMFSGKNEDEGRGESNKQRNNNASTVSNSHPATRDSSSSPRTKNQPQYKENEEIPKNKQHYHLKLIEEILKVTTHLNSNPPKKYTFKEWVWFLKLIGEDEEDPTTHRKAIMKPTADAEDVQIGTVMPAQEGKEEDGDLENVEGEAEMVKWSWVGHRSPVMGEKEEAEWVLERLIQKLQRELESVRRDEVEMTTENRTHVDEKGQGENESNSECAGII